MRLHRFLVRESLEGVLIQIADKDLLHQWTKVLRYAPGVEVMLLNGVGEEIEGFIEELTPKNAHVRVIVRRPSVLVPSSPLTLCFSPLKRELTELVLQKGTELGVSVFQPIVCERTIKDRINQERLQRILKEATEQSGRVWLPELRPLCDVGMALTAARAATIYFATLEKDDRAVSLPDSEGSRFLFIGPEGGWTEREEQLAKEAGAYCISLSEHVLRAETACIAGVALLQASVA